MWCIRSPSIAWDHVPALAPLAPMPLAIVELAEGPRVTARLVDCEPADIRVGLEVEACYEDLDDLTLVHFKPA